jgi:hypothetical protein
MTILPDIHYIRTIYRIVEREGEKGGSGHTAFHSLIISLLLSNAINVRKVKSTRTIQKDGRDREKIQTFFLHLSQRITEINVYIPGESR